MKRLILVADLASDDLSKQEIRTAVCGFAKDPSKVEVSFIASYPSTIHTAYLVSQIVETEEQYGRPLETVIFQNTDTRMQSTTGVDEARGAQFIIVRLASGMYLCGPNAGYDFSLVKEKVTNVFVYNGLDKGSQFRSRDLYSRVVAYLMDSLQDDLDLDEIGIDQIPDLQGFYIGHIDNFGNIKTTITVEELKGKHEYGDEVSITINDVTKKAKYVSNLFGGIPGELVMYPGSSGQKDNRYLEISAWRHFTEKEVTTGVHAFNTPHPGAKIEIM